MFAINANKISSVIDLAMPAANTESSSNVSFREMLNDGDTANDVAVAESTNASGKDLPVQDNYVLVSDVKTNAEATIEASEKQDENDIYELSDANDDMSQKLYDVELTEGDFELADDIDLMGEEPTYFFNLSADENWQLPNGDDAVATEVLNNKIPNDLLSENMEVSSEENLSLASMESVATVADESLTVANNGSATEAEEASLLSKNANVNETLASGKATGNSALSEEFLNDVDESSFAKASNANLDTDTQIDSATDDLPNDLKNLIGKNSSTKLSDAETTKENAHISLKSEKFSKEQASILNSVNVESIKNTSTGSLSNGAEFEDPTLRSKLLASDLSTVDFLRLQKATSTKNVNLADSKSSIDEVSADLKTDTEVDLDLAQDSDTLLDNELTSSLESHDLGRAMQDLNGKASENSQLQHTLNHTSGAVHEVNSGAQANRMSNASLLNAERFNAMPNTLVFSKNADDNAVEIEQKVLSMAARNLRKVEIALTPETLGRLKIEISMNNEGHAKVHFVTATQDAKDLISQSLPKLKELMESSGISLEDQSVEQGMSNESQGRDRTEQEWSDIIKRYSSHRNADEWRDALLENDMLNLPEGIKNIASKNSFTKIASEKDAIDYFM